MHGPRPRSPGSSGEPASAGKAFAPLASLHPAAPLDLRLTLYDPGRPTYPPTRETGRRRACIGASAP